MKTIDTLVSDIYAVFDNPDLVITQEEADAFGRELSGIIKDRLLSSTQERKPTIRMSNVGETCTRKLWYNINKPQNTEKLPPPTRIKFLFGDILESLLLFLAKKAGHTVEGQQDELTFEGVVGHRDAVIDGVLVDVKSASTYSFKKFEEGLNDDNDAFGYRTQLGVYLESSQEDPLVKEKDKAAFLVIDKTLGNITLSMMKRDVSTNWKQKINYTKYEVMQKYPPVRTIKDVEEGKSGNRALSVKCSYCNEKVQCWPKIRTFLYSTGPKFLTHVEKTPNVQEVF